MTPCIHRPASTETDHRGRVIAQPEVRCLAYRMSDQAQWVPVSRAHLRANPQRCGQCTSRDKCNPPLPIEKH